MMNKLLTAAACAAFLGITAGHAQEAAPLAENEWYTQSNIWVEHPKPAPTTNYHVGEMIPVGSKVVITASGGKTAARDITFTREGRTFVIRHEPKHTKVSLANVEARLFKKTNPLESEAFKAMSEEHQNAVKAGQVLVGMTKEAVLMSYGYPPEHETPATTGNFWKYWRNRFATQTVTFLDGKVSATAGF